MEKSYLHKYTGILFIIILLTINVTKVISFTDTVKFNMALSDIFIPIFIFLSLSLGKQYGYKNIYKGYMIWICLGIWLVLAAWSAILSEEIIDTGWMGLVEEFIKTAICIVYFFVGYNTLRFVKLKKLQFTWSIATLLFVVAGFAIYILAIKGLYFWSDDPKYLRMFMGTDTDPNHAATFLTLSFFGMGIFAMLSENLSSKVYFYGMMSLSTVGLIFTGSRGGLIGFAIGVFVLLNYYAYKNWRIALALILIIVMMISVFLTVDQIYLNSVFSQKLIYKLINIESDLNIRANLSRVALMMGIDHPLIGVGRGNFKLNSAKYFEKLSVEVIDNIPHNTYFGVVAETGLIGLILFLMPFFMILYTLYKRYSKNYLNLKNETPVLFWLLASVCALSVQAFVLNVENRRFLWFIAGILIIVYENDNNLSTHPTKYIKGKNISYGLLILFIVASFSSFMTARSIHVPYHSNIVTQNYIFEIPMKEFSIGKPYDIGINLIFGQNEESTDRVILKIVEESNEGAKKVLDSFTYKGASGNVVRTFTPTMSDSKIYLKVQKLDQSLLSLRVLPLYLISEDYVFDFSQWYFLQIKGLKHKTLEENKVSYLEWVTKTNLSLGIKSTFNNQLRLESVSVNQLGEANPVITLKVLVLTDIKTNLTPLVYGFPDNLHVIDENQIVSGYESYPLIDPVQSNTWSVGETRELKFVMPRNHGVYNLKLGFYHLLDNNLIYLPVNFQETSKTDLLDLGSLNLDEFSEGIIYE